MKKCYSLFENITKSISSYKRRSVQPGDDHNNNGISSFKIAATYIGTVVGAGFASGQEVLQFFGYHGLSGFTGLLLTTIIFIIYGYIILKLGMLYQANSHSSIIRHAAGQKLGPFIDIIITFFLFGTFTAMIAGSGAIFQEHFGINIIWGNIIMLISVLITTLMGISGIVSAISLIVPLLLVGVLSISVLTVLQNLPFSFSELQLVQDNIIGEPAVGNWLLSAITYASYNLIIAVAILGPLGAETKNSIRLKHGAVWGGIGLGTGAMAILITLLLNMPAAEKFEIPMLYIAGKSAPIIHILYSIVLLTEVYTTAVGNLYGFASRLAENPKISYKSCVIITGLLALITSRFGFSNLVHYIYPAVGYAGLIMLGGLTIKLFKS